MLTIEFDSVEERIKIGDLFDQIGFEQTSLPSDDSGDSFIKNDWSIEALSLDGYYPVEGFRWTKPERKMQIAHRSINPIIIEDKIPTLDCSPEHLLLKRITETEFQWVEAKTLLENDVIVGSFGSLRKVVYALPLDQADERLCDLQVSIAHSYMTNDILSHNSHFLTMIGANALQDGRNVLHYTFELSETSVGTRYDSNLCDIDSNEVMDRKEDIKSSYDKMKLGRLFIKEYPTNSASIFTLRAHIERLDLKGFKPYIIIIDYADIMRSTRQYDSLRHELKLVYEELRALAMELGVPVWTASQSNKEGANSDVIDVTNMSEAYGKAMICDGIVTISRKAHEKSTGWGRLFVAKNRAGRDGLVYPVQINTARSKFTIVGSAGTPEQATAENETEMKKALRDKWKELQGEMSFVPVAKKENFRTGTDS